MNKEELVTVSFLKQILTYDEESGKLFWKKRPPELFDGINEIEKQRMANLWNFRQGKEAFTSVSTTGYLRGRIKNRDFYAHRVIWALNKGYWPIDLIDHKDGNRKNNLMSNLRETDTSGNAKNQKLSSKNKSGQTGVYLHSQYNKWVAQISINGKAKSLGVFETLEEAIEIRKKEEKKNGYQENHGKIR